MENEVKPPVIVDKPPVPIIRRPYPCDSIINAIVGAFSAGVAATLVVIKFIGGRK